LIFRYFSKPYLMSLNDAVNLICDFSTRS
jgi:hypothetical protein